MMPRIRSTALSLAGASFALVLAVAACDDTTPTRTAGPATLSVYLTDDPGVDRVWVEVRDVVLVGGGSAPLSVLDEATELIEISELDDEAVPLVEGMDVDPATFNQIRFVVGDAILVTTDGSAFVKGDPAFPEGVEPPEETGILHCPSCARSGLKVQLGGDVVVTDGDNGLMLDFDVEESFGHEAGRSGRWVMHPVIHAQGVDPDDVEMGGFSGSIAGTVAVDTDQNGDPLFQIPECPAGTSRSVADFVPVATATTATDENGDPLEFDGATAEDGSFSIGIDEADTYGLGYLAEQVVGSDTLFFQARVDPAEATVDETTPDVDGVSYTLEAAECRTGSSGSGT